jgi:hypothetical protein
MTWIGQERSRAEELKSKDHEGAEAGQAPGVQPAGEELQFHPRLALRLGALGLFASIYWEHTKGGLSFQNVLQMSKLITFNQKNLG